MTYDEYWKRSKLITHILVLFITVDVIITIAGLVVGQNPIFALIMLAIMFTHGAGSIYLDNELEKEYEQDKKD